jgi:DNA-directed RNA polymerase subunit E'/Rpb7
MYFEITLSQNFFVSPKLFKNNMKEILVNNFIPSVEGMSISSYGQILFITEISGISSKGKLLVGSPCALFNITYKAITHRAFRGEILFATITNVTKFGFFTEVDNLEVFVSYREIPISFKYHKNSRSFYNPFRTKERLCKDSYIRLRVIAVGDESRKNQALGTIKCKDLDLIRI